MIIACRVSHPGKHQALQSTDHTEHITASYSSYQTSDKQGHVKQFQCIIVQILSPL